MAKEFSHGRDNGSAAGQILNVVKKIETERQEGTGLPIRIIVADDRRLCRECLRLLIETIDPRLDVVEARNVEQIGPLLERNAGRSVVLYNLVITDDQGVEFVETLSKLIGDMPLVVMCDAADGELMRGVMDRGAKAFLPSTTPGPLLVAILHLVITGGVYTPPEMQRGGAENFRGANSRVDTGALRESAIAKNFPMLTPRQRHVLTLLSQGFPNRDIAESLSMCENTVKAHVKQIMRKLQADNRTQAALMADRLVH